MALLSACSSTHVQSSRHPAGMAAAPIRNVTVVAMDERPEVRTPFENDTVAFLRERGVEGNNSYAVYSFADLKGDKEQIRQRLLAAKAESVLIVRVTERADFVAGPPASLGSVDMAAVDESRYNAFTTPGGDMNTTFRLGARLFRVSDGAVLWSGLFSAVLKEEGDSLVFIQKVTKTIVERLAKDKVIP